MDERDGPLSELTDLIEAASAAPGKAGLLKAVIRAADDAVEPEDAVRWLAGLDPTPYDADVRRFTADFLEDQGETPAALRWLAGDEPKLCLDRAHILLGAGRMGEAAEAYVAAITADPSLKDGAELDAKLAPKQAFAGSNVVNLRGPRPAAAAGEDLGSPGNRLGREPKTFADVGGLDDVKKDISRKIIQPFKNPSLFSKFKRKAGGGVLLYGPRAAARRCSRARQRVRWARPSSPSRSPKCSTCISVSRRSGSPRFRERARRETCRAVLRRDRGVGRPPALWPFRQWREHGLDFPQ